MPDKSGSKAQGNPNPPTALERVKRFELLSVENPDLAIAAKKHRRVAKNLIVQLRQLFPNKIEQSLAIGLMKDFPHMPQTIKQILDIATDGQGLKDYDAIPSPITKISKLDQIQPILEEVLTLIKRVDSDFADLGLTTEKAMTLVIIYGDNAYDFLDGIYADIERISRYISSPRLGENTIARMAVSYWEDEILPYCKKNGAIPPLRMIDFFEEMSLSGHSMIDYDDNWDNGDDCLVERFDEEGRKIYGA